MNDDFPYDGCVSGVFQHLGTRKKLTDSKWKNY